MENTLTSFINRVDFVKNSEMGNPIYRVTFTPSKGKTMIGYTRSKSHLSQICPSFEGDTCDVAYDINDKGKVIVRDIKKCGGEMNESKLKKIINESVRKTLNELDWKTYANKESKLRRIVGESINRVLKENANVPDFYDFIDILERNGWSYSDYQNVQTRDGRSAKRYIVYKDDKNSSDFKTLQQGLKNTFGDNVDFGIAQYRYAPEIKHYTVIILDYNDDDASAPLNESKLRRIVSESIDKVLNEVGDTPKGQRKLGALHARKHLRDDDYETIFTKKSKNLYDYIKNARGGDKYDYYGNNLNPMYADYANGYMDYLKSHPQEYIETKRRRQMDPYSIDK